MLSSWNARKTLRTAKDCKLLEKLSRFLLASFGFKVVSLLLLLPSLELSTRSAELSRYPRLKNTNNCNTQQKKLRKFVNYEKHFSKSQKKYCSMNTKYQMHLNVAPWFYFPLRGFWVRLYSNLTYLGLYLRWDCID